MVVEVKTFKWKCDCCGDIVTATGVDSYDSIPVGWENIDTPGFHRSKDICKSCIHSATLPCIEGIVNDNIKEIRRQLLFIDARRSTCSLNPLHDWPGTALNDAIEEMTAWKKHI